MIKRPKAFINFLTVNSGGSKVFKKEYYNSIKSYDFGIDFIILASNKEFEDTQSIKFITIPNSFSNKVLILFTHVILMPLICAIRNIDVVLNFGDIPILTRKKQIFYFDWPYAVYPESKVWEMMSFTDKIHRKIKLFLFKLLVFSCDAFIAQSNAIKKRLSDIYKVKNVNVIRMGYDNKYIDDHINPPDLNEKFKNGSFDLIYPTKYYPHKNVEILIDVAELIRVQELSVKIYCTVDKIHHPKCEEFIKNVKDQGLDHILILTGELDRNSFDKVFSKADALIMPTLLETYGIPYIEALASNKLIFTSDLDFAHATCGDSAIYFDPHCPNSIVEKIKSVLFDPLLAKSKIIHGGKVMKEQKSWPDIMKEINDLVFQTAI